MRVGLLCLRGAINMASWLGNAESIVAAFEARGHDVVRIDLASEHFPAWYKPKQAFHRYVLRDSYSRHREPRMLRYYGETLGRRVAAARVDVVLSLTGMPVAELPGTTPVVLWNDAPFDGLVGFYPSFSRLSRASLRDGTAMERRAHERAIRAVYSSDWGAATAARYGYPERLRVVPYGANVIEARDADPLHVARSRQLRPIELVWLGMEWHRKGGDVALAVATRLERAGVPVRLRLAGAIPPRGTVVPAWCQVLGFVSGSAKKALLDEAHFLILPTLADCSPIVFAEAAACATPSLASRVGGVPAMVRDGVSGQTFAPGDVDGYVRFLTEIAGDIARYEALCAGALALYRSELNWTAAAASMERVLREAIGESVAERDATRPSARVDTAVGASRR